MPNEKIAVIRGMETLLKGVATYLQKLISSAMANEISKKYAIVIGLCAGIGKSGAQSQVWEYPVSTLVQTTMLLKYTSRSGITPTMISAPFTTHIEIRTVVVAINVLAQRPQNERIEIPCQIAIVVAEPILSP